MIKKLLVTLYILLGFVAVSGANAQPAAVISDASVRRSGDSVVVQFDVAAPQLKTNSKLIILPVLSGAGQTRELEQLNITGRSKMISDARRRITNKGVTIRNRSNLIHYRYSLPYEPWMENVTLSAEQGLEVCCNEIYILPMQNLVESRQIYFEPRPVFTAIPLEKELSPLQRYDLESPFLYPAEYYDRRHEIFRTQREKGSLRLFFKQGVSTIDHNFRTNAEVLDKINHAIAMIKADESASVKKIVIVGMSSPEGSFATNSAIAMRRAQALKQYLMQHTHLDNDAFELINGEEDWDGLRRMVEDSDMASRNEVINIIDTYQVITQRKNRLVQLESGKPYRYMRDNFFPELRNAGFIMIYYQNPSVKENPEIDRINAAKALMSNNKFEQALDILVTIKDQTKVYNELGVSYMMTGNYAQAEKFFALALIQGDPNARQNMDQLDILKRVLLNK